MTREELIAALEAAEGPSRELDAEIARADGYTVTEETGELRLKSRTGYDPIPRYTASIDAAITLVPEGCDWDVGIIGENGAYTGHVITGAGESGVYWLHGGKAPTPALALCIAALKAREDTP